MPTYTNPFLAELVSHICPQTPEPVEIIVNKQRLKLLPELTEEQAMWRDSHVSLEARGTNAAISQRFVATLTISCVEINGVAPPKIFAEELKEPVKQFRQNLEADQTLTEEEKEDLLETYVEDQVLNHVYEFFKALPEETISHIFTLYSAEVRTPWLEAHRDFFGSSKAKPKDAGQSST